MSGGASRATVTVDRRELRINPPGVRELAISGRRAVCHLDDGRQVVWEPLRPPGRRLAVDAERADRLPRAAIAERHRLPCESAPFALAWTELEVHCKLADVPIVVWLRERNRALRAGRTIDAAADATAAALLEDGRLAVCVGFRR